MTCSNPEDVYKFSPYHEFSCKTTASEEIRNIIFIFLLLPLSKQILAAISLVNNISKQKIKTTNIPNRRAIDEKRECINLLSLTGITRATSYNYKYFYQFLPIFCFLNKGIYLQTAKDKLELLIDVRFKQKNQSAFNCSKIIETLEPGVKYVPS